MAVDAESLLFAIGLSVACAFIASLGFRLFKIPDIIFLIGFGVVIGPWLGLVEVQLFRDVAPLLGAVAIIIILFEGGLKIQKSELLGGVASGGVLALVVFGATALLGALAAHQVAGLEPPFAIMLGMAMGGAGVVIVIPLIQHMDVNPQTRTVVSIEAAVSDVLVILGVVGVASALAAQQQHPAEVARTIVQTFAIGIILGGMAGFWWAKTLKAFTERSYEYVLTISALFLLYSVTEFFEGSGPLAVLVFGLVLGNSRKAHHLAEEFTIRPGKKDPKSWAWVPVFGTELAHLHHEVVFFIRTFFFVTLGVVMDLSLFRQVDFLILGFLLTVAVAVGRWWSVELLFRGRRTIPAWDRKALSLMFPLGLAAAVVSLIPYDRFGIEGTETFGSYAAIAIVLTNFTSAILVFLVSRGRPAAEATPKETPSEGSSA